MVATGVLVLAGMGVAIAVFLGLFVYAALTGNVQRSNPRLNLGENEYGEGSFIELERSDDADGASDAGTDDR